MFNAKTNLGLRMTDTGQQTCCRGSRKAAQGCYCAVKAGPAREKVEDCQLGQEGGVESTEGWEMTKLSHTLSLSLSLSLSLLHGVQRQ